MAKVYLILTTPLPHLSHLYLTRWKWAQQIEVHSVNKTVSGQKMFSVTRAEYCSKALHLFGQISMTMNLNFYEFYWILDKLYHLFFFHVCGHLLFSLFYKLEALLRLLNMAMPGWIQWEQHLIHKHQHIKVTLKIQVPGISIWMSLSIRSIVLLFVDEKYVI